MKRLNVVLKPLLPLLVTASIMLVWDMAFRSQESVLVRLVTGALSK